MSACTSAQESVSMLVTAYVYENVCVCVSAYVSYEECECISVQESMSACICEYTCDYVGVSMCVASVYVCMHKAEDNLRCCSSGVLYLAF